MSRKTLANPADKQEITDRIKRIQPSAQRRWGKMNAHQMICHLCDSFRGPMGARRLSAAPGLGLRWLVKWIALDLPFHWPHGVKTRPEADQLAGGTPPVDFETDRDELLVLLERFAGTPRDFQWHPHPMFGAMSDEDWMRWGYLHVHHHLRQFGV